MRYDFKRLWCLLAAVVAMLACPASSFALITGGTGNEPLTDPGWLPGAAAVFNVKARVAYWEGPPFGGGQYVAECRGDTEAFHAMLVDFAKIEAPQRKLYLHDGVGNSFWLNINNEEEKRKQAEIDWSFTAWIPAHWKRFRPGADARPDEEGPFPELHVYTGGQIKWDEVKVPEGIEVIDQRLESHGFTALDGTVLEGVVRDIENKAGIAAQVELQQITPLKTGGYEYETAMSADTDAEGRWVLKSIPSGWYQVVASAEGYVPRKIGYEKTAGESRWRSLAAVLAKPGPVSGVVVDAEGNPLADVSVRFDDLVADPGEDYSVPDKMNEVKTDSEGRFVCNQIPRGTCRIWIHKPRYCRPGLGQDIETPTNNVQLKMVKSSTIEVVVQFQTTTRPAGYLVEIEPEGGSVIGSWGGSGNIDAEDKITFHDVPPGRYVLHGQPNPGSAKEQTESVTIELIGGEEMPVVLKTKE